MNGQRPNDYCTQDPFRNLVSQNLCMLDHRVINRKLRFCFKVDIVDSLWQYVGTCTPFKPCVCFNQCTKTLEFLRVRI